MKRIKTIMIILLVGFVGMRIYFFYSDWSKGKARQEAEQIFQETIPNKASRDHSDKPRQNNKAPILPKVNAKILGKIDIDSQGISYIILDGATDRNLAISISKVTGPAIHEQGNLVLAGHNMRDGSLFGKLRNLEIADAFRLQDLQGISKEYVIFKKKIVKPTDVSVLDQPIDDSPLVTLITCTKQGDQRLIYFAKQK